MSAQLGRVIPNRFIKEGGSLQAAPAQISRECDQESPPTYR
jgi:hypothetical protein